MSDNYSEDICKPSAVLMYRLYFCASESHAVLHSCSYIAIYCNSTMPLEVSISLWESCICCVYCGGDICVKK